MRRSPLRSRRPRPPDPRPRQLEELLKKSSDHWGFEDPVYRFYHQSFKVYYVQERTTAIVKLLKSLAPDRPLNPWFAAIVAEGTGKTFTPADNARWPEATRPIVEALLPRAVLPGNGRSLRGARCASEAVAERVCRAVVPLRASLNGRRASTVAEAPADRKAPPYLTRASSSSMTCLNTSNGWAPITGRPLMYIVGVDDTPSLIAVLKIDVDDLGELARIEALRELRLVEPQRGGVLLERGHLHLLLVGEDAIVHLPVLALLAGAVRGFGRLRRRGMVREAGSP